MENVLLNDLLASLLDSFLKMTLTSDSKDSKIF